MEFWKWYLSKIKEFFNAFRRVPSGWVEYVSGIAVTVLGSLALTIAFTPLWLIATIPIGITLTVHGLWRVDHRAKG